MSQINVIPVYSGLPGCLKDWPAHNAHRWVLVRDASWAPAGSSKASTLEVMRPSTGIMREEKCVKS